MYIPPGRSIILGIFNKTLDITTVVGIVGDMNSTTETKNYWEDTNGRVCCDKHIGYHGTTILASKPNAKRIKTDMTTWVRMNELEVADFTEFLAEYGKTEICEGCR